MESFIQSHSRFERLYLILVTFFSLIVVVSNLIAIKLFSIPFTQTVLSAGLITYPITFIISDLVTEIFGIQRAKFMVCLGFIMSLCTQIIIQFALWLPHFDAQNQEVFSQAFGMNGLIVFSSMLAYLVGQIIDVRLYELIKTWTGTKHLWLRNNGSTIPSQLLDTLIVNYIVFFVGLQMPIQEVILIMGLSFLYKTFFSLCSTPILYLSIALVHKYLRNPLVT